MHKIVRRVRETKARLTNNIENLTDIITRVNLRSDSVVQFYEPKIQCKLCDREGHTQVSCDLASSRVGENMSYEDAVFWHYVDPEDRPEGFDLD